MSCNKLNAALCEASREALHHSKFELSGLVIDLELCRPQSWLLVHLQLLEESRVYQVVPFMTHLELNHVKDDKSESQRAHLGQEAVKMINAGLQPEYRGCFKLQVSLYMSALLA